MNKYKSLITVLFMFGVLVTGNLFNLSADQAYGKDSTSPEEVFKMYTQAQSNGNLAEYRKYISETLYNKTQTPGAEEIFKQMGAKMMVKNVEITGRKVVGDKAILNATGKLPMSERPANGTITIVKENGEWKVKSEEWVSKDNNSTQRFSVGVKN